MNNRDRFLLRNKFGFINEEIKIYSSSVGVESVADYYISQAKYKELRRFLDYKGWNGIIHNKWFSSVYLSNLNIPTPKTYGLFHPNVGRTIENESLRSAKDVEELVKEKGIESFVLKHVTGGKGNSVFIVDRIEVAGDHIFYHTVDEQTFSGFDIDKLAWREYGGVKGFILQEKIIGHPFFGQHSENKTNFLRVYTLTKADSKSDVKIAYVNLNVRGLGSTQAYQNAHYAAIDINTGVIKKEISFFGEGLHKASKIMESQPFEGLVIPKWDEVKKIVCIAADHCPGLNWVGWDVVLSPNGPYLIEGNVGNTMSVLQAIFGGFIDNGILDEWIEHLNIPIPDGNDKGELINWKKRYIRSSLKNVIRK